VWKVVDHWYPHHSNASVSLWQIIENVRLDWELNNIKLENAWQSLACSPPEIARSPKVISEEPRFRPSRQSITTPQCPLWLEWDAHIYPKTAPSLLRSPSHSNALDRPHSPPQTASIFNQPFFHNSATGATEQLTYRQSDSAVDHVYYFGEYQPLFDRYDDVEFRRGEAKSRRDRKTDRCARCVQWRRQLWEFTRSREGPEMLARSQLLKWSLKTNFTGSSKYGISVLHSNILTFKLVL